MMEAISMGMTISMITSPIMHTGVRTDSFTTPRICVPNVFSIIPHPFYNKI